MSDRTFELLRSLEVAPGPIARLLGKAPHASESLLREVASSFEVEAALALLPLGLKAHGLFRDQVLDALDALVRAASPSDLAWLDDHSREVSPYRPDAWASSGIVTPSAIDAFKGARASALGVASLHRSGYVREAAVRALNDCSDPLAIAFLLLRANDWVEPVRSAAVEGLGRRLQARTIEGFVPFLDLAFRLATVRRNDLRPFVEALRAALVSVEGAAALQGGCASELRTVRRRCIELALEARTFDLRPLVRSGLRDPDPVVRGIVAREVGTVFDGDELLGILEQMLASATPRVRYSALETLVDRFPDRARTVEERMLLDAHPHVRGTARWLLRSDKAFDTAAFFRHALASAGRGQIIGAIEGLGDAGSAADAAALAPFLSHSRPRVRRAVLRALAQLDVASHREAIIGALSDPSPRVSRCARDILRGELPVDAERLVQAALTGRFLHERRAAVDLMRVHDHWAAGLLLLRVAAGSERDIVARAETALRAWEERYNRVFVSPTREQVEQYKAAAYALPAGSGLGTSLRLLVPALETRILAN